MPGGASRHEARERALALLYEADSKMVAPASVLDELPVVPDPYAVDLVCGVERERDRIDALIAGHAIDWTVERMPVIDRTVLRMGTYELLARPDVPTGVVLSEAVELAKRYSTEDSGRFVNGVLAAVADATRPGSSGQATDLPPPG
jgi:N utilization substance protein B